jgi:hypothetical protein
MYPFLSHSLLGISFILMFPVLLYDTEYIWSTTVKHNNLIFLIQCYRFGFNESSGITTQNFKKRKYTCSVQCALLNK